MAPFIVLLIYGIYSLIIDISAHFIVYKSVFYYHNF